MAYAAFLAHMWAYVITEHLSSHAAAGEHMVPGPFHYWGYFVDDVIVTVPLRWQDGLSSTSTSYVLCSVHDYLEFIQII
jgi:hypothetical protein